MIVSPTNIQFSSVTQSCLTLRDPMDCSTLGLPVHHQLLEFTQLMSMELVMSPTPSHPLSSLSPPAFNLSQHQGLFNESALRIRWPKYWSFRFTITPSNEHMELISFRRDWSTRLSRVFSNTTVQKHQFFCTQPSL